LATNPETRDAVGPHLVRLTEDPDAEVRAVACSGVASALPAADALRVLSKCADDPQPNVRAFAVRSAAGLGVPEARSLLANGLEDDELPVRFEAALGLAMLRHPAGFEVLLSALSKSELRYDALSALFALGDTRALPKVRSVFRKFFLDDFERTQAAGTLARLGDEAGKTYLLHRIEVRRAFDRGLAIELCGEIPVLDAKPCLLRTISDRGDRFRGAAARALGAMQSPEALKVLRGVLQDENEDPDVRMDAVDGLLRLATPEARSAILEGAQSVRDAEVRSAATDAASILPGT
jgi:HEAT repeat protein